MNGKHYLGQAVSDFERYGDVGPITGVQLLVDTATEYSAGDSSGYVLTVQCTFGTQEMANNILLSIYQKQYRGFRADGAPLSPEAELGDAVTVCGVYSMLAYRKVEFGPGHFSEISAPGEKEISHEYQYTSTSQKNLSNDADSLRAYLQKALYSIQVELNDLKARMQILEQTVNTMSNKVTQLDSKVTALDSRVTALEGGS